MTARDLQKAIVADLDELFKDDQFKTPEYLSDEEIDALMPAGDPEEWSSVEKSFWDGLQLDHNRHRMAPPKSYPQNLPLRSARSSEDESDEDPFPYLIVRLESGGIESQSDPARALVIVLIGIFDDDPRNQGHMAVLELIERIQRHYEETPVLGPFVFEDPFRWALQEEDGHPYFFGACELTFQLPAPRITQWEEYA